MISQSTTLLAKDGRVSVHDLIAFVARIAATLAAVLAAHPWVDVDHAGLGYENETPTTERRL